MVSTCLILRFRNSSSQNSLIIFIHIFFFFIFLFYFILSLPPASYFHILFFIFTFIHYFLSSFRLASPISLFPLCHIRPSVSFFLFTISFFIHFLFFFFIFELPLFFSCLLSLIFFFFLTLQSPPVSPFLSCFSFLLLSYTDLSGFNVLLVSIYILSVPFLHNFYLRFGSSLLDNG